MKTRRLERERLCMEEEEEERKNRGGLGGADASRLSL